MAVDHYHRYKGDVALMKSIGATAYRFSISWPRIFPEGAGKPNPKGLDFYSGLVDELKAADIEPFATLHHRHGDLHHRERPAHHSPGGR